VVGYGITHIHKLLTLLQVRRNGEDVGKSVQA
jgi:hypothetical protein